MLIRETIYVSGKQCTFTVHVISGAFLSWMNEDEVAGAEKVAKKKPKSNFVTWFLISYKNCITIYRSERQAI